MAYSSFAIVFLMYPFGRFLGLVTFLPQISERLQTEWLNRERGPWIMDGVLCLIRAASVLA